MNIDFHYGMMYVVTRLAGMNPADAKIVAHSCQYVDDATTNGVLKFAGGESYERFASAHTMLDYKNQINDQDKLVWAPFHFLPAGKGDTLEEKAICRPDSEIAKEMMRKAIDAKDAENSLHRLGISLHVYVDTWAHQGFSGMRSNHNMVKSLEGDQHDYQTWEAKIKEHLAELENYVVSNFLDSLSKLGHGAALHFPDMPWAKWNYINGNDEPIRRENLPDFVAAANMACKAVQGFMHANRLYENELGLSDSQLSAIEVLLRTNVSHNEQERLENIYSAVKSKHFQEIEELIPKYIPKGEGSWKHSATGIKEIDDGSDDAIWSDTFEDSDYRKFHDAIKEHRFVVTQIILPLFHTRIA